MSPTDNRTMFDTIRETAPFRLKDLARLAHLSEDTITSYSMGRRVPPDEAFPPIADALEEKAAELRRLARQIRKRYPTARP